MYVRVDSQGEITSYAPIHIIDENGRLRDVYAFDRSAADGRENQTFSDVFQSMVKGRSVSAETAVSEEVIREQDWAHCSYGNRHYLSQTLRFLSAYPISGSADDGDLSVPASAAKEGQNCG